MILLQQQLMNLQVQNFIDLVRKQRNKFLIDLTFPKNKLMYQTTVRIETALNTYLMSPTEQYRLNLQASIMRLNRFNSVPKYKSRLCGGLLEKGSIAYRCFNCMNEDNSVVCQACFEFQRHKDHVYEKIKATGCCDCGDEEKWKADGFCHVHQDDVIQQIIIDEAEQKRFLEEQIYAIQILFSFYRKFKQAFKIISQTKYEGYFLDVEANLRQKIMKQIEKVVNAYGEPFVNQLIAFNKAGVYANTLTNILFQQKALDQYRDVVRGDNILEQLMDLVQLSSIPQKMCDFFITMFQLKGFRQKITIYYFKLFNTRQEFPRSQYSHISAQLMTSYITISTLLSQNKIQPLKYLMPKQQISVKDITDSYMRLYYDLNYLSKIYGNASIEYFMFVAKNKQISSLASYRQILHTYPDGYDYYGIETILIDKFLPIIRVMERETSGTLSNLVLIDLFQYISRTDSNQFNLFIAHERLFTLTLISKLKGNIHLLNDDSIMKELFQVLKIKEPYQLLNFLSNVMTVIQFSAEILEDTPKISFYYTFYAYYFKKSNLSCIDSMSLKIIIKMIEYYNKINENIIKYEQHILSMKNNPLRFIDNVTPISGIPTNIQQKFLVLKNYLGMFLEMACSDLTELNVLCLLNPTKAQLKKFPNLVQFNYSKLAFHYYECLLRSETGQKVTTKKFKQACELFFNEEQAFREFIKVHRDVNDPQKLIVIKDKGPVINEMFFKMFSLRQKADISRSDLTLPYVISYGENRLRLMRIEQYLMKAIYFEHQRLLEGEEFDIVQQKKQEYISLFIIEFLKLSFLINTPQLKDLFSEMINQKFVQAKLQSLNSELIEKLKKYNKTTVVKQVVHNEQKKKAMEARKKQKKQKLKKLQDTCLQSYQKNLTQISKQEITQCCLCKETDESGDLYFISFFEQSKGQYWTNSQKIYLTFSTCGHYIHRHCSSKAKGMMNKIYTFCPLCKSPTNIIIPLRVNEKTCQKFYDEVLQIASHNEINVQAQTCLFNTLLLQIGFRGLTNQIELFKKTNILQILYRIHQFIISQAGFDISEGLADRINSIIFSKLKNHKFSKDVRQYYEQLIKQVQINNKVIERIPQLPYSLRDLKQSITIPILPDRILDLKSKYIGKCRQCAVPTNDHAICLLCPDYVTCFGCKVTKVMTHCKTHLNCSVFIRVADGSVVYVYNDRYVNFPSLYEDYLGRPFSGNNEQSKIEVYELNHNRYKEIKGDILGNRVEFRLRRREKEVNKTNTENF